MKQEKRDEFTTLDWVVLIALVLCIIGMVAWYVIFPRAI